MDNLPNVQGPVNISVPKTLTTVTSCEAMALHVAPLERLGVRDCPERSALTISSTLRAVVAAEGTPLGGVCFVYQVHIITRFAENRPQPFSFRRLLPRESVPLAPVAAIYFDQQWS